MRRAGFAPNGPSRAPTDALSHVMAADLAGTGVAGNLLAPGGGTRGILDQIEAGTGGTRWVMGEALMIEVVVSP